MGRFLLLLLASFVFIGTVLIGPGLAQGQAKVYVCPPCNCGKDEEVFTKPGTCPVCGMTLVEQGVQKEAAVRKERPLTEADDSATTTQRTTEKIGAGVYMIRHEDAPDQFPQGNTMVVIGSRSVLVVDSCYMPSSARKDILQIRKWTSNPVKYLLNSHWHFDHTMGNDAYKAAFPGITILAHRETAKQIRGYNPGWFERYPKRGTKLREMLASGKDDEGKALDETGRKALGEELRARDLVWQEFKSLSVGAPTRPFEDGMELDLGGRRVQVKHLGRGNTLGDAIAWLPKERILAAGDLLDHPVPYLGGGFPLDEIGTLERMRGLHPRLIVPGHGALLHGEKFLNTVIDFIRLIVGRVNAEVFKVERRAASLDLVQAALLKYPDMAKWRKRFCGDDPDNLVFFDTFTFPGLVKAAHADSWRK